MKRFLVFGGGGGGDRRQGMSVRGARHAGTLLHERDTQTDRGGEE